MTSGTERPWAQRGGYFLDTVQAGSVSCLHLTAVLLGIWPGGEIQAQTQPEHDGARQAACCCLGSVCCCGMCMGGWWCQKQWYNTRSAGDVAHRAPRGCRAHSVLGREQPHDEESRAHLRRNEGGSGHDQVDGTCPSCCKLVLGPHAPIITYSIAPC